MTKEERLIQLLRRYIDNHCANADAEGMSAACDCKLCQEARKELGLAHNRKA